MTDELLTKWKGTGYLYGLKPSEEKPVAILMEQATQILLAESIYVEKHSACECVLVPMVRRVYNLVEEKKKRYGGDDDLDYIRSLIDPKEIFRLLREHKDLLTAFNRISDVDGEAEWAQSIAEIYSRRIREVWRKKYVAEKNERNNITV